MKRKDIERILKEGSVKQKIKLYMTDIALSNLDFFNIKTELIRGELIPTGTKLLSNKERELLWSSIKTPKDVKYYKDLVAWNQSFILFKDKLTIDLHTLLWMESIIVKDFQRSVERSQTKDLVNEMLDLMPDNKTRDKALKKALSLTEGGIEYQEKGYPKYLDTEKAIYWTEIKIPTEIAIKTAESCKEYIEMFKTILAQKLPLKPYRDWVKNQEKELKRLTTSIYSLTTTEDCPTDFPKMKTYEEIEAHITDEDVEDFKNSGI
jgi:hypothetical protein